MGKVAAVILVITLATGCAGKVDYFPPASAPAAKNSIIVEKNKADVWNQSVQALGKHVFVINNLDEASGSINLSYTGDPEKYVDCGRIYSYVRDSRGERTFDFPAAKGQQVYEQLTSGGLFLLDRKMNLEGRMNIALEEVTPSHTRITVNARYTLTRTVIVQDAQDQSRTSDTVAFESGQLGRFEPKPGSAALICGPNGTFERDVLSLLAGP